MKICIDKVMLRKAIEKYIRLHSVYEKYINYILLHSFHKKYIMYILLHSFLGT